jgi:hypothetical protein
MAPRAAAEAEERWRAAVAALYEMTRLDRPRRPVSGCDHCVPEADARTLMEVPRESAPESLMDRYGFKALTTWGDERDLRWFLPRLVELLAICPGCLADPGIVADKVVMAGFATWPADEQVTVRAAFLALWRLWLDGGRPWRRPFANPFTEPVLGPDDILPGLAMLGIEIAPLVDDLIGRAHHDPVLAGEVLGYAELVAYQQWRHADCPHDVRVRAGPCYFLTQNAVARLEGLALRYADDTDLGERFMAVAEDLDRHRAQRARA